MEVPPRQVCPELSIVTQFNNSANSPFQNNIWNQERSKKNVIWAIKMLLKANAHNYSQVNTFEPFPTLLMRLVIWFLNPQHISSEKRGYKMQALWQPNWQLTVWQKMGKRQKSNKARTRTHKNSNLGSFSMEGIRPWGHHCIITEHYSDSKWCP